MDEFTHYYRNQAGGSYDAIGPVYRAGFTRQRGAGLASFAKGLWSWISPIFSSGASALGKHVLTTGANILNDAVASGGSPADLKRIAKERATEARDNVVSEMRGAGRRKAVVKKKRKRAAEVRTKLDIFNEVPLKRYKRR